MKTLTYVFIITLGCFSVTSCDRESDQNLIGSPFIVDVMYPTSFDKRMGDVIFINVNFENKNGEVVDHVNVKIRDKANTTVAYNKPDNAEVSGEAPKFYYEDQFKLSAENGISPGDWVLEATSWKPGVSGSKEVTIVEFHVRP